MLKLEKIFKMKRTYPNLEQLNLFNIMNRGDITIALRVGLRAINGRATSGFKSYKR